MGDSIVSQVGPPDGGNYEAQWSNRYLTACLLSDVGVKREHNEDSCLLSIPEAPDLLEERGILVAVADGMGGASAGEFASRLALQTLKDTYYQLPDSTIPERLQNALLEANRRVFQEAQDQPELEGMGTTLSAVVVRGPYAYIAHVGDSRVYLGRPDETVRQITFDHSLVAEQVRNGIISEEEARHHAMKNLITRAVGTKSSVRPDAFTIELQKGDTLLICSDGLSNVVEDPIIQGILTMDDLEAAGRKLIAKAIDGGGPDNVTAVLVRVTGAPPKAPLEGDIELAATPKRSLWARVRELLH